MRKLLLVLLLIVTLSITACGENTPEVGDVEFTLHEGIDTIEINSDWDDGGAQLTNGTFSFTVYSSDNINTSTSGLKQASYTVEFEEVTYTLTRYIVVQDQTPPELELIAGIDTIKRGMPWEDMGIIVNDNSMEVITPTVSGTVTTLTIGTYTITYTATDSSGNTSTILRFVTVIE